MDKIVNKKFTNQKKFRTIYKLVDMMLTSLQKLRNFNKIKKVRSV